MLNISTVEKKMNLNINIPEEYGEVLDTLAEQGYRSRRAQARKLLIDALDIIQGDNMGRSVSHTEQSEKEVSA